MSGLKALSLLRRIAAQHGLTAGEMLSRHREFDWATIAKEGVRD